MNAGFQLAGIAIAILRIGNWALPLFEVVWPRNRNICELFRLIETTKESCKNPDEKHLPALQILSKNIGTVLSSYTLAFNKQNRRRGNLFARQTKVKILYEAYTLSYSKNLAYSQIDYATACFLYIHQNPVMAGLVSRLKDWEFSSFRDYAKMRDGKLVQKETTIDFIELDFDNFREQSKLTVDDNLLKEIH